LACGLWASTKAVHQFPDNNNVSEQESVPAMENAVGQVANRGCASEEAPAPGIGTVL